MDSIRPFLFRLAVVVAVSVAAFVPPPASAQSGPLRIVSPSHTPAAPRVTTDPPPPVDSGARRISLADLEGLALANNPTLEQARAGTWQAYGQRVQQGLYPNPQVGYSASEIGSDQTAGQQGVFASQEFVTADKLHLSSSIEAHRQRQAQHVVEAQEQRVLTAVRREFYAVLAAQRRLEIASDLERVADLGVRITEARMRALEGAKLDVLQAQIEAERVRLVARTAENDRRAAWRRMAAVIGIPGIEPVELEGNLDRQLASVPWESAWERLSGTSPQLAEARAAVDRAAAALRRAEVQPIPNVFVQASVQQDFAANQAIGGLQIGVPLPIFDRNQGNIASAHAEYVRACREVERRELVLRQRLAEVYRDYANAETQVGRYRDEILPKALETLKLSESLFEQGESSYLQLLTAQRTYGQTKLDYVAQLAELWESVVAIEGLLLIDGLAQPELAMPIE